MFRPRTRLTALVAGIILILAACSSGDGDDSTDNPPDTTTVVDTEAGDDVDDPESDDEPGTDDGPEAAEVSDTEDYIAALEDGFSMDDEDDSLPIADDDVRCFATGFVDLIGPERYAEAGWTAEDLTFAGPFPPGTADESVTPEVVHDIVADCGIDVDDLLVSLFTSLSGQSDAEACFHDALTDDNTPLLVAAMMGLEPDGNETNEAFEAFDACVEEAED